MWNRMKMWCKSELYHSRIDGDGDGDGVNATLQYWVYYGMRTQYTLYCTVYVYIKCFL